MPLAPVPGREPNNWLCHPLPLFMAVSMILNTWRIRRGGLTLDLAPRMPVMTEYVGQPRP